IFVYCKGRHRRVAVKPGQPACNPGNARVPSGLIAGKSARFPGEVHSMKLVASLLAGFLGAAVLATPALAQKSEDMVRIGQRDKIGSLDAYLDPRPEMYFARDAVYDTLISYDFK